LPVGVVVYFGPAGLGVSANPFVTTPHIPEGRDLFILSCFPSYAKASTVAKASPYAKATEDRMVDLTEGMQEFRTATKGKSARRNHVIET